MKYLSFLVFTFLAPNLRAQDSYLYVGSYTTFKDGTPTGSEGIYVYHFHSETGKLDSIGCTEGVVESPSFLAVSPNNDYLYAGSDTRSKDEGTVSAFDINRKTGELTFINKVPSSGLNPIYVNVAANNAMLLAANYGSGSFTMFKLLPDGKIAYRFAFQELEGSSVDTVRQTKPHPHMAAMMPNSPFIVVTDLGADAVYVYVYLSQSGLQVKSKLDTTGGNIIPGSGPRHIAFHPKGKSIYLLNEMSGSIDVFSFDLGDMELIQRIATHPDTLQGPFEAADIHFSPDGKFLYASNRGTENNIAIYKVSGKGKLSLVGYQSTLGETPRNFTLDPTGKFLLVANQKTGNVVVFSRDTKTGLLSPTGQTINVPEPSCLKMIWK